MFLSYLGPCFGLANHLLHEEIRKTDWILMTWSDVALKLKRWSTAKTSLGNVLLGETSYEAGTISTATASALRADQSVHQLIRLYYNRTIRP